MISLLYRRHSEAQSLAHTKCVFRWSEAPAASEETQWAYEWLGTDKEAGEPASDPLRAGSPALDVPLGFKHLHLRCSGLIIQCERYLKTAWYNYLFN